MARQAGLIFTFKRNNFSPYQYTLTAKEDSLNILKFTGCSSLIEKIECLAKRYELTHEKGRYFIRDFSFLKDLLYLLRNEKKQIKEITNDGDYTTHSIDKYFQIINEGIKNLESLLFYISERIAASQMFQKLSDSCYFDTEREMWMAVCKYWGNFKPSDFELIFWME